MPLEHTVNSVRAQAVKPRCTQPFSTHMAKFGGRIALITGSASGIGQATAVEFARCGARLALTDVNETGLQETVKLCKQQGLTDEQIFIVTGDLFKEDDIQRIARAVENHFGGVDILVNNAGRSEKKDGPTELVGSEQLDNSYQLLFRAPVLLTKYLIPTLRARKGNVVNVASVFGLVPAIQGIHRSYTAVGRYAQPAEIARAVVYLASDDAAFVTGHNLAVDGGHEGRGIITHGDIYPVLKARFPEHYGDQ